MAAPFDRLEYISAHHAVSLVGPNVCGDEWECCISTVRGSPVSPVYRDVATGRGKTAAEAITNAMEMMVAAGDGEFPDLSTKEFLR